MTRPYLLLESVEQYRDYYNNTICKGPAPTIHGIKVFFSRDTFDHAFFESPLRDGVKETQLSYERAMRMGWIRSALVDPSSDWRAGWDRRKQCVDPATGVCITDEEFVVVIALNNRDPSRAHFRTCYRADNSIGKIRSKPCWP